MVNLDAEIYEHLNKQIKINELRYGIVGGQVEAHRSELSCRHRLHGCT